MRRGGGVTLALEGPSEVSKESPINHSEEKPPSKTAWANPPSSPPRSKNNASPHPSPKSRIPMSPSRKTQRPSLPKKQNQNHPNHPQHTPNISVAHPPKQLQINANSLRFNINNFSNARKRSLLLQRKLHENDRPQLLSLNIELSSNA